MKFRRKYPKFNRSLIIIIGVIVSLLLIVKLVLHAPERQAVAVVKDFYSYEQDADFSSSWALFHPLMQEKFAKGSYLQDRAHVFMNHFGVETFTFTISKTKKLKNWNMAKDTAPFKSAYRMTVIQTYKGKYGNFDIHQEVFAVKEKGEWLILWDYNL